MLSALPVLIICSDSALGNKAAQIVRDMSLPSIICDSLTDARSLIESSRRFSLSFAMTNCPIAICGPR